LVTDGTGTIHRSGEYRIESAPSLVRALMISAIIAGSLSLAGCYSEDGYRVADASDEGIIATDAGGLLDQKNMPMDSPILVRIFKEESELEVWKQDTTSHFQILKVYPICRWSGDLGPKVHEGDRQAPEGFYTITPELMNPKSNYYLAINTGFPNTFDKANDRHGAFLMIHGDCSSRGCYAMTDEQIGEIYSLARESFHGGQQSFQIQAYPFRMTPANLARHRTNPEHGLLADDQGRQRPFRSVAPRAQGRGVQPALCVRRGSSRRTPRSRIVFNPTGRCPAYVVAPEIADAGA
jgi:hypothetical protein